MLERIIIANTEISKEALLSLVDLINYVTSKVDKWQEMTTATIDLRNAFLIDEIKIKKWFSWDFTRAGQVDLLLYQPQLPDDSCKQQNIRRD